MFLFFGEHVVQILLENEFHGVKVLMVRCFTLNLALENTGKTDICGIIGIYILVCSIFIDFLDLINFEFNTTIIINNNIELFIIHIFIIQYLTKIVPIYL